MPSSPSQQSNSTLLQPCSSTWCKMTFNDQLRVQKSLKHWKTNSLSYLTVKLNRGLSFELVSSQIGVMRRLDVVVGQRVLQLLRVHLGLLDTRSKVLLIHQEPGMERGMVTSNQSHVYKNVVLQKLNMQGNSSSLYGLSIQCISSVFQYWHEYAIYFEILHFYSTLQSLQMTSNPFASCLMRAQISAREKQQTINYHYWSAVPFPSLCLRFLSSSFCPSIWWIHKYYRRFLIILSIH